MNSGSAKTGAALAVGGAVTALVVWFLGSLCHVDMSAFPSAAFALLVSYGVGDYLHREQSPPIMRPASILPASTLNVPLPPGISQPAPAAAVPSAATKES